MASMPRCGTCGCLARHHFYCSYMDAHGVPIDKNIGGVIKWCQHCLEDERPLAIHKYCERSEP